MAIYEAEGEKYINLYTSTLSNLAALYRETYSYEKAAAAYDKVLEINFRTQGPNSLVYARNLQNLARFYSDIEEEEKAIE